MIVKSARFYYDGYTKIAVINGETYSCQKENHSCRAVAFVGPFVVKVEEKGDLDQTVKELSLWKEIQREDKKHFAPILEYGENKKFFWIVMAHISGNQDRLNATNHNIFIKIRDKYYIRDLLPGLTGNVLYNPAINAPTIVDYGL